MPHLADPTSPQAAKDRARKRLQEAKDALTAAKGDLRPDAELELIDAVAVAEEFGVIGSRGGSI